MLSALVVAAAPGASDWTRFGSDAARSSAGPASTGITAQSLSKLRRQQVQLDGTVDSSAIFLRDVQVGGKRHDVLVVTTTYGRTEALDAANGHVLWRFTPSSYATLAGSAQITTATPVADPDRRFVYAASPDGYVQKLALANGHAAWRTKVTLLPSREKIASSLNLWKGRVVVTTGGYIGDAPPYQGHVVLIAAASGRVAAVWNSLCSDRRRLIAAEHLPVERLGHLGPCRRRGRAVHRRSPGGDRQRAVERQDGLGRLACSASPPTSHACSGRGRRRTRTS